MVSHHLEVERKYECTDLRLEAPVITWQFESWTVDPPIAEELDATYFDTALGQLGDYDVALRRRIGGYDQGWHIKFDVSGKRHEVTFELTDNPQQMPQAVQSFLEVLTNGSPLEPRVGLFTHRTRTLIRDHRGRALAEICDDKVRSTDYLTGLKRSWHEWEVELLEEATKNSDLADSLFAAVEELLLAAGAQRSSSPAKIARALGKDAEFESRRVEQKNTFVPSHELRKQPQPQRGGNAKRHKLASSELLASIISRYSRTLGQADLLVRAGVPDCTHQGRIAARQLRSILTFMALPYAQDEASVELLQQILRGLKTYAAELEQHRNGELILPMVQLGVKRTRLLGEADLLDLAQMGKKQTRLGLMRAIAYLDSVERRELQASLHGLVENLCAVVDLPGSSEKYLAKLTHRVQKKLVKRGSKVLGSWPANSKEFAVDAAYDEGVHDLRKLAKAARYCLTVCLESGQSLNKPQESLLKNARLLQSELGKLTDELTFLDWLKQLSITAEPTISPFTVGCLAARSECEAEQLREAIYHAIPQILEKIKSLDL